MTGKYLTTKPSKAKVYHTDRDGSTCPRVREHGVYKEATQSEIEYHGLPQCPDCDAKEYRQGWKSSEKSYWAQV